MTGSSISLRASSKDQRKSVAFHGWIMGSSKAIPRPESHLELAGHGKLISGKHQHLFPMQRSLDPVHVVISHENIVEDRIKVVIDAYVKEGRRPLLNQVDPSCYEQ
ncbi:hypothetical protein AMTRI_Chr03g141870 [Amborella trichopoda]